jgi:hypothetical protein
MVAVPRVPRRLSHLEPLHPASHVHVPLSPHTPFDEHGRALPPGHVCSHAAPHDPESHLQVANALLCKAEN